MIERARVVELPLNGRNAADLTKLVAGAVDSNNGAGTTQGDTKQVPGAEQISVNGARPDQISYNLDGGTNQDLMSNTNNPFPFPRCSPGVQRTDQQFRHPVRHQRRAPW